MDSTLVHLHSYMALLTHRTVGRKFMILIEWGDIWMIEKNGDIAKPVIRFFSIADSIQS